MRFAKFRASLYFLNVSTFHGSNANGGGHKRAKPNKENERGRAFGTAEQRDREAACLDSYPGQCAGAAAVVRRRKRSGRRVGHGTRRRQSTKNGGASLAVARNPPLSPTHLGHR